MITAYEVSKNPGAVHDQSDGTTIRMHEEITSERTPSAALTRTEPLDHHTPRPAGLLSSPSTR